MTFGLTIQDILNNPQITVGIFSFNKTIAQGFLKQIKVEFEENEFLKQLFPEILYKNPKHESKRWNEDAIVVKRKGNPKEATVECAGLIDNLPTGRHYKLLVYDDVINEKHVNSTDLIKKAIDQVSLSFALGQQGGRKRFIGTRYHSLDVYGWMLEAKVGIPRLYPATTNGQADGDPVLFTPEYLNQKKRENTPHIFACQYLLDPLATSIMGFKREWLNFYGPLRKDRLNKYILVDPANTKNKRSDYTVMLVIGMSDDDNFYILDMIRDRLNPTEKAEALINLHKEWKPVMQVGYEQYGMQADIHHIKHIQGQLMYNFRITPLGGKVSKTDRIMGLIPLFQQGRIWMPDRCLKTNIEGETKDLTRVFMDEEYMKFPVSAHDDMLDCLSRILDNDVRIQAPSKAKQRNKNSRAKMDYTPF